MKTNQDKLMEELCAVLSKYNLKGLGVFLQVSSSEQTACLIEGNQGFIIEGLVNGMDQRKEIKEIVDESIRVFCKYQKDKDSVDNLIERALGYKPKDLN